MNNVLLLIISFAAWMTCLYMEKKCEKKIAYKEDLNQFRMNLLSMANSCSTECMRILEHNTPREASKKIDDTIENYKTNAIEIYNQQFRARIEEISALYYDDYCRELSGVKSTYHNFLEILEREKNGRNRYL